MSEPMKQTMKPKKVLIITYYWPPSGGVGVHRWLKFAKYLPGNGWSPVIFTAENPDFSVQDETLLKDVDSSTVVIKKPIWEPFGLYKKLFGKSTKKGLKHGVVIEKSKLSLVDRLAIWIRANIMIPDPRVFWVRSSVRFLSQYVRENDIDAIVTTGPPHSVHLIGLGLKKRTRVKWLADFRDPWSDWDVLVKMKISKMAKSFHVRLEKKVVSQCDILVTVSNRLGEKFAGKSNNANVKILYNGIDEEDFEQVDANAVSPKFQITHTGMLHEMRNPTTLWQALKELCLEEPEFRESLELKLVGTVSESILDFLRSDPELGDVLSHNDHMTHKEVLSLYSSASLLLILLNQTENARWILPVKMYEYMYMGKPILALGLKDSDAAEILKEHNGSPMIEFSDKESMKETIRKSYELFKSKQSFELQKEGFRFTRRHQTVELSNLLNSMTES